MSDNTFTPAPQNQSIATGGVPAQDWGSQQAPNLDEFAQREAEAAYLRETLRGVDVQKYGLDNKARPSVPEDADRYMPPKPKVETHNHSTSAIQPSEEKHTQGISTKPVKSVKKAPAKG